MTDKENQFEKTLFNLLQKYGWLLPVTEEQVTKLEQDQETNLPEAPQMPLIVNVNATASETPSIDVDFSEDIYNRKVAATTPPPKISDNPPE